MEKNSWEKIDHTVCALDKQYVLISCRRTHKNIEDLDPLNLPIEVSFKRHNH